MAKKVLMVCTSHDKLGDTDTGTGCWVEEVAAPYYEFKAAGYDVTIASIKGGEVPFDEASLGEPFLTKVAEKFYKDDACMNLVKNSVKLADVKVEEYDAIFMPGGHGACWDFPNSPELIKAITTLWDSGKVVAAVCHGPCCFANAVDKNGIHIVKGRKVTGFSNAEEVAVKKDHLVPFKLEDKLKELGGLYEAGPDWASHALRDGNLITGQNPGSSEAVGKLIVEVLGSAPSHPILGTA